MDVSEKIRVLLARRHMTVTKLAEENYNVWKDIYEKEYGIPLYYTTEKEEIIKNKE